MYHSQQQVCWYIRFLPGCAPVTYTVEGALVSGTHHSTLYCDVYLAHVLVAVTYHVYVHHNSQQQVCWYIQ